MTYKRKEQIGNCTLYLGDGIEVMMEMPSDSVDMVLSDIPYGEVSQDSKGLRRLDRGKADDYWIDTEFMVKEAVRICGSSFYVFCGTKQISELVAGFSSYGLTTRVGVWEKTNPSPMNGTRLWVSGIEFCVFARKAKAVFTESCQKAVWRYASGKSTTHPTEKPVDLMQRLIGASSNTGDAVIDFTMGSGTTGVACAQMGRSFIGVEIDETYFNIACQRIEDAYRQGDMFVES